MRPLRGRISRTGRLPRQQHEKKLVSVVPVREQPEGITQTMNDAYGIVHRLGEKENEQRESIFALVVLDQDEIDVVEHC